MKKLTLQRLALPVALCACSVILAGCDTPGESAAMSQVFGAMAGATTGQDAQTLALAAQSASIVGGLQEQDQRQAAIDSQRQQHERQRQAEAYKAAHPPLPNGAYSIDTENFGKISICSCNFYKDFNKDGFCDFPDEFVGIKTNFGTNEKITIAMTSPVIVTGWKLKIWDGNGDTISDYSSQKACGGVRHVWVPNRLAPGNYSAAFYNENTLIKKINFVVTPN